MPIRAGVILGLRPQCDRPSTVTPAGRTVLVNHLEGQLDRAKPILPTSEQRIIPLAHIIRVAGGGYGGGQGMGGGMPMGAGMGMFHGR
jgi:hypothetical protein